MILYVLKKKACSPKHVRILLSLFRKYNILCQSITYLELRGKEKFFQKIYLHNNYQFPPSQSPYKCIYFITNFNKCELTPRNIKEKFRKKFGHTCIHASDNNQVGDIEIDNIQYPKNKILYIMSHIEREKSLEKKGYFM